MESSRSSSTTASSWRGRWSCILGAQSDSSKSRLRRHRVSSHGEGAITSCSGSASSIQHGVQVWSSSSTCLPVGAVSRQRSSCPVESGKVVFAPCKTYRRLRCQFVVIHSQCRSGLQWCPVGGAVPRRRSSGSLQSGRSRVCAKKDKESSSTESTMPEAVHRLLRVTQHPPPLHELHRHSLSAGAPGSRLRVFGFRGARPG